MRRAAAGSELVTAGRFLKLKPHIVSSSASVPATTGWMWELLHSGYWSVLGTTAITLMLNETIQMNSLKSQYSQKKVVGFVFSQLNTAPHLTLQQSSRLGFV